MLRPERMSKVSVTGSRAVMDDVIETVHELNLVHLSDYDGSWEGFEQGNPIEGADDASEKLVTVRSLESILDIDEEDAGPSRIVTDEALEDELQSVREEVNELDDRRSELEDELRDVEDRLDSIKPFADLGIDLDLLSGYETLQVAVGEADEAEVRSALADADSIAEFGTFSGGNAVAVFAYPEDSADEDVLDELLVGVDFASLDVPDAQGSPEEYVEELEHERQKLESKLDSVENELENVKLDTASFLLAAEEKLTIDVQKAEAPLNFATTENAFVAEGWIPTERYTELTTALGETVGDRVEVDELERASYDAHEAHGPEDPDANEVAADGGTTMDGDQPPVVQDNPGAVKPFELLVETINRPKYFEFDPTVVLFLTFPAFFGFMIGDLGYGLLYLGIGYWLYSSFDNDAIKSLGGIALWAGGFTALFGILYGEIFGLHLVGEYLWGGHPPIHKGLQPVDAEYALSWMVISILAGLLHMTVGYVFDFVENLAHDPVDAVLESGSWVLLFAGIWTWIFSRQASGKKPDFLFTAFNGEPFKFGFSGFSPEIGTLGLVIGGIGLLLYVASEVKHLGGPGLVIGVLESLSVLSDALSYTRIAAVLLAKAGMAFVVNLLFFGVYVVEHGHGGAEWHFMLNHGPQYVLEHHEEASIMFPGLMHSGIAGLVGGLLVLVIGHLLVLALGITSAGLQAVRLEYVEFFGKFYEGGGEEYEPFGHDRTYTTQD
ncbi:V-type ATP synthase subunit I [Halorussus gelatinilyticus]|uniref:A-type ATP synthase subunit I n=1 Tax=Halorussus gelatinilyticus TaxID=2937524 RepID=A0A8U0IME7_9EURY|nr:V-type ATP synthase subunit I [Halorussus gelatinilyticus]UPW01918.1 V-type ATP synthase subunit I [Halorussus gelatinilyticus]